MQKIFILFALLSLSVSCKTDQQKKIEETEDTNSISETEHKQSKTNRTATTFDADNDYSAKLKSNLPDIIQDFIQCKEKASERTDCRNRITQVISETYDLSEFNDPKLGFVIYDSIRPIIEASTYWQKIGTATDQETLNKATEHANNGGLSLIIDTSTDYGHVVMILPGDIKKSGSWNMNLPDVLSLLNYKPEKSFYNKSLSYAFEKSEDLQIYTRQ
ncbi:hypothetical protein [Aquimarina sp. 2201CG5-10]|uniref:hypothetical protein n=1 Tax=Aquimarina callyspongiae TaxID=3098150 RepID=UPI002AB48F22|nr:hypothetical protein [Aquimarina sp. 2201CG5-10]MDY8135254.1 hypothetical protein [Aquimarina sp. 2201CG5-10]